MGVLYIVGTPIGNLEDITLRALRVLREVPLIAAEDTRHTRKLLTHYDIHTPLTSFHQHSPVQKRESLLAALSEGDLALVSDAGMPGVSDPGSDLVAAAIEAGHAAVPVPGPSAVLAALVASGLPTDGFLFAGFPPRTGSVRRKLFTTLGAERRTIILYEAPTRLLATLADLRAVLGERPISVAREITKLHEEHARGTVSEAIAHFETQAPRGEVTIVVGGGSGTAPEPARVVDPEVQLRAAMDSGLSARDAVAKVTLGTGRPRKEVYRLLLRMGLHDKIRPS